MAIVEELIQNAGMRYSGGTNAPVGSYFNPRTNAVFQQSVDGILPLDGIWIPLTTSGASSLAQCATIINALVQGLGYTAANLHLQTASDLAQVPGQSTNDG